MRRAVATGAGVAVAVALPALLGLHLGDAESGGWRAIVLGVIVCGIVAGGVVAARTAPDRPLAPIAAGLLAYAVLQAVSIARLAARDEPVAWFAIPILAVACASVAATGGAIGQRQNAPRGRAPRR